MKVLVVKCESIFLKTEGNNSISNKIYNLDETGNSDIDVPPKIICAK